MSLFFLFIAISSVSHPTHSNGRSAKKKDCFFALWKNDITVVSLFASYCYFIQEARHRFRKKKSTLWHNIKFAYVLWMSRRWWGSRYVFMEESFSHRRWRVLFKRKIFRCQLPQHKKKETNTEQCRQQSSLAVEDGRNHLKNCYAPHLLQVDYIKDLLFPPQCSFSSPSQRSLGILSSLLPFTRNIPSTRRLNSCTVLWQ